VGSGELDVVFNNAGSGLAGALEGLSRANSTLGKHEHVRNDPHNKSLHPTLREKRAGLFINTTSLGGLMSFPFNSIYHATKWAIEGWSESMAFELNQFGIGIKTIEPGGTEWISSLGRLTLVGILPMTRS